MSMALTRMFAYFTLGVYLTVGGLLVRLVMPEITTLEISPSILNHFAPIGPSSLKSESILAPKISFRPIIENKQRVIVAKKILTPKLSSEKSLKYEEVNSFTLPFSEAFVVAPIFMDINNVTRFASLYRDFSYSVASVPAKEVQDEISTKQASVEEPEFFEYEDKGEQPQAQVAIEESAKVKNEETHQQILATVDKSDPVENSNEEEVAVSDLISFDYSKAKEDILTHESTKISSLSSQPSQPKTPEYSTTVKSKFAVASGVSSQPKAKLHQDSPKALLDESFSQKNFESRLTIQVTGTDFGKTEEVLGFELRPQDDLSEAISDYNSGNITLNERLSRNTMTRSVAVLKRGFVPTNTDLIFEEGAAETSLPLIEEEAFNELISPYETMGAVGAVLVELGEDVETTSIDVPYSKVLHLNEEMKVTTGDRYTYQLYLGVKAGNTLLSYRNGSDILASKIIHVHDHEVTFESNFYESEKSRVFSLLEEDLLGKEKTPLIISSENVREFAEDKVAKKLNDHTYKLESRQELLGGRRYLELTHQKEPVFVGFKDSQKLIIPSESYMRYVLSKTQSGSVANRCVVQVNLAREVSKVEVGSESVYQTLHLSSHFIDSDGKFYESPGSKTEKLVIVGENQGAAQNSQDGKVNLKIEYVDGSVEFLGSYCSPNTYLVEQL